MNTKQKRGKGNAGLLKQIIQKDLKLLLTRVEKDSI